MQKYKKIFVFTYDLKANIQQKRKFVIKTSVFNDILQEYYPSSLNMDWLGGESYKNDGRQLLPYQ